MPKAYFVVRAIVEPPLRQRFDQWYSSHHLPMALSEFKAEKCWRFWSALNAGVHYAAYQFADMARLDAALNSDGFKTLVADFDESLAARRVPHARSTGAGGGKEWVNHLYACHARACRGHPRLNRHRRGWPGQARP
jgi:hypothetical protein